MHISGVKYLGFRLECRLTWNLHINHKKDELYSTFVMEQVLRSHLLSRQSALFLSNILIEAYVLYGIQLWAIAKSKPKSVQNIIHKTISGVTWYTRNIKFHEYLEIPTIDEELKLYKGKRLNTHLYFLAKAGVCWQH